ncbi:uncharacterized protein LOC122367333 [Amphibalanus amphitrite]|uniref:uncharacterized protein LOC122367333 n=1 Tax=Amphibalanus amphitrite TaxID=1232801 RepID=UPI001C9131E7|nr:uncharacterized protein LOC122367333 [Amphibalanus amphitrite]
MAVRVALVWCAWLTATVAGAELRATRTAQCRALCLDEYGADTRTTHGECFQSAGCLTCWEKCGSLNPEDGEDTWTPCHLLPDCDDAGCRLACQFHSLPRAAPPALPPCRPDLELSRDGAEARWSLSESKCDRPRSGVVFLLLAGAGDGWQELVQTPAESVLLVNVGLDTPLRLLAVGRDGPLAVAELQSDDATATDGRQSHERKPPSDGVWLLETVSVERDSSSMVLVQVGWQRHRSAGAAPPQYLVTWELSGGGIKGHLYTDINSVTLSLWPESVYNIQVELLSVTSERSVPLVISTYRSAVPTEQRALPLAHQAALALLAALLLGAVAVAAVLAARRCRWGHLQGEGTAPARPVFILRSAGRQKRVPSPLRRVLVESWSPPAPVHREVPGS